jgi:glycosyltransferase involved in cell wall biosynthesis
MIYYHHHTSPQNVGLPLRIAWRLYHATYIPERLSLNQADTVATVSESVKKEFEQAKLTRRPIVVVYNAPQDLKQFVKTVKTGAPKNIVYMGAFISYKNAETLIKGMKWLPGYTLHLLSGIRPQRKKELGALIPKDAHVVFYNGVSDEKYAELLANDAVLTTATLDEGFGLSVTEAQAMGVPTVVSDIPVLREVGGDAALYFNPMKPQEFAEQVKKLDDKDLRNSLIKAGKTQAAKFTWDKSAEALLSAINSLV